MAATGALAARPLAARARRAPAAAAQRGGGKKRGGAAKRVSYGDSWFDATNGAAAKTVAQQIGRRVVEDRKAGRVDRADLYTDNWDGSGARARERQRARPRASALSPATARASAGPPRFR